MDTLAVTSCYNTNINAYTNGDVTRKSKSGNE